MAENVQPIIPLPAENYEAVNYASVIEPVSAPAAIETASSTPQIAISESIVLSWFVLVIIFGGAIIWRSLRINNRLKKCPAIERSDLVALCNRLCIDLGIKQQVQLRYMNIENADSPAAIGIFRPKVFLPRRIVEQWSLKEIEPILLHELAHIKRYDLVVNWLQMIVQVVYFFHPLVWLTNWKIRQLREEICDDVAIQRIGAQRKRYGKSILRVMEETRREPAFGFAGIGFIERKGSLAKRIVRIMSDKYRLHPRMTVSSILILIVVSLVCIVLASEKKSQIEETTKKDESGITKTRESEWEATLPNGVTVKLIGICEHPSTGKQWWQPNGVLLDSAPYELIGEEMLPQNNYNSYEFVADIEGHQEFTLKWGIQHCGLVIGGNIIPQGEKEEFHNLRVIATEIPKEYDNTNVHVGISIWEWETKAIYKGFAMSAQGGKDGGIIFHQPYEKDGTTVLVVAMDNPSRKIGLLLMEMDVRGVAIDKKGHLHIGQTRRFGTTQGIFSFEFWFRDIRTSDIDHFELQTRPCEWITFKNVSLKPGSRTTVEAEIASPPRSIEKPRETSKRRYTAALSSGATLELVGVCQYPSNGKQWWRPDGTVLDDKPHEGWLTTKDLDYDNHYKVYEFVLRIKGLEKGHLGSSWKLPDDAHYARGFLREIPESNEYIFANAWGVSKELERTAFSFSITARPWETVCLYHHRGQPLLADHYEFGGKMWDVVINKPYVKENDIIISFSHNGPVLSRVIAIDKIGQTHTGDPEGGGTDKIISGYVSFKNLPIDGIERFEFQIRPYDHVTFKNVSLQPGNLTNVQIEVEKADTPNSIFMKETANDGAFFQGPLEFDKRISLKLQAGTPEEPNVVEILWIEFKKRKDQVNANLYVISKDVADAVWVVNVGLLDAQGNVLHHDETVFETKKREPWRRVIKQSEAMVCRVPWQEVAEATRFTVSIEEVPASYLLNDEILILPTENRAM